MSLVTPSSPENISESAKDTNLRKKMGKRPRINREKLLKKTVNEVFEFALRQGVNLDWMRLNRDGELKELDESDPDCLKETAIQLLLIKQDERDLGADTLKKRSKLNASLGDMPPELTSS